MINQTWLKTFCHLVDIGHFTQTAETLFMTQSGVSQHIQKLEKQLETQLLIREGKSFSLTNAGQQLYQQGQQLLRSAKQLEALIKQDEPFVGNVTIASPGSVGLKLYPHLLEIQQVHPELVIKYSFTPNASIEKELLERQLDLGLLTEFTQKSDLLQSKIAEEPLVLVTSSAIKSIDWQCLNRLGFISHPDAQHHARLLLSINFPEFEHTDQFQCKGFSNQISLILHPVSKGLGFTVLPLHAANAFQPQQSIRIHYLPIPVTENLYLCLNRHSILSKRIGYLKTLISNYLIDNKSSQSK
jgi:DNA-binding transcriptional LysR family regulator